MRYNCHSISLCKTIFFVLITIVSIVGLCIKCQASNIKEYIIYDLRRDGNKNIQYFSFLGDYGLTEDLYKNLDSISRKELDIFLDYLNKRGIIIVNFEFQPPISDRFSIEFLSKHGVDGAIVANNHSCDYGTESILSNVENLRRYGIQPIGSKNYPYWSLQVKNSKYIIYALTETLDSPCEGVNTTKDLQLEKRISMLDGQSDIFVVITHGSGPSVYITDYEEQKAIYLLQHGANLVLVLGGHLIKGARIYNGKIAIFSIGNFLLSWRGENEFISIAPIVGFSKKDIVYFSVVPFYDKCGRKFRLLDGDRYEEVVKKFSERSNEPNRSAYQAESTKKLVWINLKNILNFDKLKRVKLRHIIIFLKVIYYNYLKYFIFPIILISSLAVVVIIRIFGKK